MTCDESPPLSGQEFEWNLREKRRKEANTDLAERNLAPGPGKASNLWTLI
jgi:hypothetical protein